MATASLDIGSPFVVVYGDNGQGKTNLLEAIWYAATLKPLRGRRTRDLIGWSADKASVHCSVTSSQVPRELRVEVSGGNGRQLAVDGKTCHDLEEYLRGLQVVAFGPEETSIVSGEPAIRRAWLDRAAFNAMPGHLSAVREFKRCLSQKSAALRADRPNAALLDVLDEQLAVLGAAVVERRCRILAALTEQVADAHTAIAGQSVVQLTLRYRTAGVGDDQAGRVASLRSAFSEARESELRRGHPMSGPQKDEVVFALGGKAARTFASRGQVRSIVLALKLAEMAAARRRGDAPAFLLDDLGSELDRERTRRLLEAVAALEAQVFVTTTARQHVVGLPPDRIQWLRVHQGALEQE